jgi:hypothetical protein
MVVGAGTARRALLFLGPARRRQPGGRGAGDPARRTAGNGAPAYLRGAGSLEESRVVLSEENVLGLGSDSVDLSRMLVALQARGLTQLLCEGWTPAGKQIREQSRHETRPGGDTRRRAPGGDHRHMGHAPFVDE